ncbi:energy transducer TonB [bacterium]|nr:energy transducer TonB [bacterium]MBU1073642.1 energy transducer TonB [bacterium]MBU1676640.1 energy transducer TonB [bacterium]
MSVRDRAAPAAPHIPWAYSLEDAARLPLTGESHPLRREFMKWLSWANGAALLLGALLFAGWWLWSHRQQPEPPPREIRIVRYTDLGVPPSIARPTAPQISVAEAVAEVAAAPSIGVPEPVADELARSRTIATVSEMAEALTPITLDDLDAGEGGSLVVELDIDVSPSPDEFVAVEEEPIRISIDPPVYPQMAMSAGVEGTVIVRVLVGRDGKIKNAIVVDGQEMLRDAAIVCAKTAVFKPALLDHRPVEVWVLMPVTFKLR